MLFSYLEDPLLGGLVDQVSEHEAGEVSVETLVPGVKVVKGQVTGDRRKGKEPGLLGWSTW